MKTLRSAALSTVCTFVFVYILFTIGTYFAPNVYTPTPISESEELQPTNTPEEAPPQSVTPKTDPTFDDILRVADGYRRGEEDATRQFNLIMKFAPKEHMSSIYGLIGDAHYLGTHQLLDQDFQAAFFWYNEAAKLGNDAAKERLMIMYRNGQGTEVNEKLAQLLENELSISHPARVFFGSGFIVNPTDILTAKHVVDHCSSITVKLPQSDQWESVHILKKSPNKDIAIIQMDKTFEKHAYLKSSRGGPVKQNEPLTVAGFSTGGLLVKPTHVLNTRVAITVKGDDPDNKTTMGKYGKKRIRLAPKSTIGPGDSGSAVIDSNGAVVGLLDSGSEQGAAVIPLTTLKRSLATFGSRFYPLATNARAFTSADDYAVHIRCIPKPTDH